LGLVAGQVEPRMSKTVFNINSFILERNLAGEIRK
jgi:hypothetical protein